MLLKVFFFFFVSLIFGESPYVYRCVSVSISLFHCLYLSFCLPLSVSLCLSPFHFSLSLFLSLSFSCSVCLSVSLSLSIPLSCSVYLSTSISLLILRLYLEHPIFFSSPCPSFYFVD